MVDGWPISEGSSAAMSASAARREDGDGSGSISRRESQHRFTPSHIGSLEPEHRVCSWATGRELTWKGVK